MNIANKLINVNQVLELLPNSVKLTYVDYNDNLNEHTDLLQKCLKAKNFDALYEKVNEWYIESNEYTITEILNELKTDIERKYDIEDSQYIIDEYYDYIIDELYNRDTSDIIGDLLKNTKDINVRIETYSNYDCINSHWFNGGSYEYIDSYFGAMVDVLKLNPKKVKSILNKYGINTIGKFPNYHWRDGKEYVSYESFANELLNSTCGANLLTFVGTINARDLLSFESGITTIPKGNNCGLFSSMYGGGSCIEMELLRDFKINLNKPYGKTKYDNFGLLIDDCNGYSINSVYGVTSAFFGNNLKQSKVK